MTVLTRRERLELILTYYLLWKIKKEPRVIRRVIRYAQPITKVSGLQSLAGSSIADLGTKDHDLLDGLLDDDHTMYFHTDGTDAFTGDPDLAGNSLLTTNLLIKEYDTQTLWVKNRADTTGRGLRVTDLDATQINGISNLVIYPASTAGRRIGIFARKTAGGVVWREVATAQNDGTEAHFNIAYGGDITMVATKSVDAYTNAGYIKLRRLSQSAEPTPDVGELLLWRDTDDDKTYLVYEDVDLGGRKIELT